MRALAAVLLLAQAVTRAPLEDKEGVVAKADAELAAKPGDVELILAAGLARDKVWRYQESIEVYTRGMKAAPQDFRFPRYRGHRYISTRQFGKAVEDLEHARKLAPNSYDVSYHLALAYYLRGQFERAASEYARCMGQMGQEAGPALAGGAKRCAEMVNDADSRIAMTEWRYRSLRRAKRDSEAEKLLETVPEELTLKENDTYYQCLLFYKGMRTEKSLLDPSQLKGNAFATLGYAVANYHLVEGNLRKACPLLTKVAQDPAWNAFGAIAAETEIARGLCKDE